MTPLSCYVLAHNSEKTIEQVLKPLTEFCDQVVVVDSGSTDRTESIVRALGAEFIHHPFQDFVSQRNFAADQCRHDWIFIVDSDEVCNAELVQTLSDLKKNDFLTKGVAYDAYRVQRRWILFGKEVHTFYPITSPDFPVRIFQKSKVKFGGKIIHESPQGYQSYFDISQGCLVHHSCESAHLLFQKLNQYTTLEARDMKARGKKSGWFDIWVHSVGAWFKWYFKKRGFLDGNVGFLLGIYAFLYALLKYLKLRFDVTEVKALK